MNKKCYNEIIFNEINNIKIIDVHNHIISEEDRSKGNFFYFFPHYTSSDIVSAGLDLNIMEKLNSFNDYNEEDINLFFKFWEKAQNTAYSKSLLRGIKEIFGFENINKNNYKQIEEELNKSKRKGWYDEIYKKAKIEKTINVYVNENIDKQLDVDRNKFAPVVWFDFMFKLFKQSDVKRIEKETDTSIHTLDDLIRAFDKIFLNKVLGKKAVAIKISISYTRSLRVGKFTKYEAEKTFNKLFDKSIINVSWQDEKGLSQKEITPLQDYLIHHVINFAEEESIPVKIHTGMQDGYNNYINNSNPTLLLEIFNEYKNAKFVIMHGGYPYVNETVAIAKMFKNVYIDTCWLHIISPTAARNFLHQLIEAVPSNKVFGFGGDYYIIEGSYGNLMFTKENIARVLSEKVDEHYFDLKEAIEYARRILYKNPKEFYLI
ncbi:MAG: amidohydrolase family protein [Candidatus Humimicrobiaceae bacterium]